VEYEKNSNVLEMKNINSLLYEIEAQNNFAMQLELNLI
jgi:hypothetical protein